MNIRFALHTINQEENMKTAKILGVLLLTYGLLVATFESLIGYYQPRGSQTLIITTFNKNGPTSRVVTRLYSEDKLFVAANHWPRKWYNEAIEDPAVEINIDGETSAFLARPVSEEEHRRVSAEKPLSFFFRFITGFPPRKFLHLEKTGEKPNS
jgi:hypothetical protein